MKTYGNKYCVFPCAQSTRNCTTSTHTRNIYCARECEKFISFKTFSPVTEILSKSLKYCKCIIRGRPVHETQSQHLAPLSGLSIKMKGVQNNKLHFQNNLKEHGIDV